MKPANFGPKSKQSGIGMTVKDCIYRLQRDKFEIVIMHDEAKQELQLFFKSNRMKHFRPLMNGNDWLHFDQNNLLLAVQAANDAAAEMMLHDDET